MRFKPLLLLILSLILTACDGLTGVDTVGTLDAENILYGTEIAELQVISQEERIRAQETITADETRVAVVSGINHHLLATLVREITPTPPLQAVDALSLDSTQVAQFAGQRLFVKTGVSDRINADNGCVIDPKLSYPASVTALYATVRAQNLGSGVPMRADWTYENELVYSEEWIVDRNYNDICIWFDITPQKVEMKPGFWSVRLFAENFTLEDAMTFVIESQ